MRLVPDAVIDSAHHPEARRVTDVLRGPAGARRTFLIDDEENIIQAVRRGIRLDGLYLTDDAPSAHEPMRAAQGTPVHVISARVGKEPFGVEKRSRRSMRRGTSLRCARRASGTSAAQSSRTPQILPRPRPSSR